MIVGTVEVPEVWHPSVPVTMRHLEPIAGQPEMPRDSHNTPLKAPTKNKLYLNLIHNQSKSNSHKIACGWHRSYLQIYGTEHSSLDSSLSTRYSFTSDHLNYIVELNLQVLV